MVTTVNDNLPPCPVCAELDRDVSLPLDDWWSTVEHIGQRVADGTLVEEPGTHRFSDLTPEEEFLGDLVVEFRFRCRTCGRAYRLAADTDRAGVHWGPPPGPPPDAPDVPWRIDEDAPAPTGDGRRGRWRRRR